MDFYGSHSYIGSALLLAIPSAILLIYLRKSLLYIPTIIRKPQHQVVSPTKNGNHPASPYPAIIPLDTFDWKSTNPLRIRPFGPSYQVTMNLFAGEYTDLIQIDNTYLERITQRRHLVATRPHDVIGPGDSRVKPAINELYSWLLGVYLPQRFPTMFELRPPSSFHRKDIPDLSQSVTSLVTGDEYPIAPPTDQELALKTLAGIVDEELLLLLPALDGDGYILGASIWLFQNGVRIVDRVGCRIRDIHKPVPEYKQRLEKSMDRYFSKLPVGKLRRRETWSICTSPDLYNPSGKEIAFDPDKCNLHIDNQTLHRLPNSKALLLAFHQYKTPISELRDEDDGKTAEALLMGIDGLAKSAVKEMSAYKGARHWGEDVKRYLKREE